MRVRALTAWKIAQTEKEILRYESYGDDYADKVESLRALLDRLQEDLRHYDDEAAAGLKKPARWRWRNRPANARN